MIIRPSHDPFIRNRSICHCALDSVEEAVASRAAAKKTGSSGDDSAYLGLLYPTEEFKVYG